MYKYTKLSLLILIFLLFSCTPRHRGTNVDSELYSIYVEFLEDAKSYGVNIDDYPNLSNLKFNSLSEETVGVCITDGNLLYKYRTVFVNTSIKDPFLLKFITYHEIGHCIFGLSHDDGEEISIMTPEINLLYRDRYKEQWDSLLHIYFTKVKDGKHTPVGDNLKCTIK